MKMNEESLIDMYKVFVDEERFYIKEHQSKIAFYTGLIIALLGAIMTALFKAKTLLHYCLLLLAPIILWVISKNGKSACSRFYRRFLEAITTKAKIEHLLGMDVPNDKDADSWVKREQLINSRYMIDRDNSVHSSGEWVQSRLNKNDTHHLDVNKLFFVAECISVALIVFILSIIAILVFIK